MIPDHFSGEIHFKETEIFTLPKKSDIQNFNHDLVDYTGVENQFRILFDFLSEKPPGSNPWFRRFSAKLTCVVIPFLQTFPLAQKYSDAALNNVTWISALVKYTGNRVY